jgi:hypothetical protein
VKGLDTLIELKEEGTWLRKRASYLLGERCLGWADFAERERDVQQVQQQQGGGRTSAEERADFWSYHNNQRRPNSEAIHVEFSGLSPRAVQVVPSWAVGRTAGKRAKILL